MLSSLVEYASSWTGQNTDSDGAAEGTKEIGPMKVSQLFIHPIKSCRGTSVQQARFTSEGLEYDRKWAIIDAETRKVLTARDIPEMVLITPTIEPDPSSPDGGSLTISFPPSSDCAAFSTPLNPSPDMLERWAVLHGLKIWSHTTDGCLVPAPASDVLSAYTKRRVQLVYKGPAPRACDPTRAFPALQATVRYQDGYPLLLVSEEGLEEVGKVIGEWAGKEEGVKMGVGEKWREGKVGVERFRPNIVLKGSGVPFIEDALQEISLLPSKANQNPTAAPISLVAKCPRCLLPNVDPEDGTRDKAVPFKVLMKFRTGLDPENMRSPCFGCNGVPRGDGVVCVGDDVAVTKWLEE